MDYGQLKFDAIQFSAKMNDIVQKSQATPLEERIKNQLNNMPSTILESKDQMVEIIRITDIIIFIVAKYVVNITLPTVLEEINKDKDIKDESVETLKAIATDLLSRQDTQDLILTHLKTFISKSRDYMTANPGENVDIDKLYALPTGGMANSALEIFSTLTPNPEKFTHIVILDDNYGYTAVLSLDPKNIDKGENK